jgi:CubicO group peptidase (beta-lactamase class C family)
MFKRYHVLLLVILLSVACDKRIDIKKYIYVASAIANDTFAGESEIDSSSAALDSLFAQIQKRKSFNGNVLIAQRGKVLLRESIGMADFASGDTLKMHSAFQLASVSKHFTAAAILILYEQGNLQLDDTLQTYLPDFPYRGITIRHLLTHRSGLPNYTYFCEKYLNGQQGLLSNQQLIQLMTEKKPPVHYKPNRRFQYSNTGYAVLAAIIEKASGQSYADFLEDHIFDPVGMESTFVRDTQKDITEEDIAYGFNWRKRPLEATIFDGVAGDKGVYSTIDDLYLWDQALYSNEIIKQETLKLAFTPATRTFRYNQSYGFGWRVSKDENGNEFYWHGGWWEGYKTYFLRRPVDRATIIVLSNLVKGSFLDTGEILRLLTPDVRKHKPIAARDGLKTNAHQNKTDGHLKTSSSRKPMSAKASLLR